jgi:hypothetical protein
MSSSRLTRWSGLAALVGGGLFVILAIVEPLVLGSQPYSEAAASGTWIVVQGAYIVAAVLIGLGLVGLYLYQAQQAGTLGLIAFLVTFIGSIMAAGSSWSETFFGSWLANLAPELLDADPTGALIAGILLSYVLFALGWFLFGLASLRAEVLPRGAAILLMIGALLFAVVSVLDLPFAGVLFGAALVWMGYGLWSGVVHEPRLMPKAAT